MHGEGVEHAERRGNAGVPVHVTIGAQHGGGPGEGVRDDGVVVVGLVGVVDPHAQAREHVAEQAIDSLRHLPGPLLDLLLPAEAPSLHGLARLAPVVDEDLERPSGPTSGIDEELHLAKRHTRRGPSCPQPEEIGCVVEDIDEEQVTVRRRRGL